MKRALEIATSFVVGIGGAALFILIAYSFHFGGLGQTATTVTLPTTASDSQLTSAPVPTGGGIDPQQIYQKYADSVVQIVSTFQGSGNNIFHQSQEQQGVGSGFVVNSDGYILTNAHVVTSETTPAQKATDIEVNFRNGKKAKATIVGYDLTSSDIAVIKVDPAGLDLVPAALGDSDKVNVGEPVVAIGSPFGIEYASTLTSGIVSGTKRTVESPSAGFSIQNAIQTDAAINPGNSGGPLINSRGEVIGLNEQIASSSGGSEGVGFAVPINTAKQAMDQILSNGSVEYAWLGVVGQTVTSDVAKQQNLSTDKGALITDIVSGAPAEKAGLQKGDIITAIDGQAMNKMEDVSGYLTQRHPGDKVKVTYLRGSDSHDADVELAKRPDTLTPQ
ncbi:MAG: trypsin-like peptidase domain-containing protein [Actinobacteria bacterium]|nr:trypsin-like peptidase domain-containing protein [Actinomycetota bacterium]